MHLSKQYLKESVKSLGFQEANLMTYFVVVRDSLDELSLVAAAFKIVSENGLNSQKNKI